VSVDEAGFALASDFLPESEVDDDAPEVSDLAPFL
jgi:hypothetical protein